MVKSLQVLPTVGGQPSLEGFAALYAISKGVNPMGILEVVAIIGLVLTAIKFGFTLGKNAKK